MVIKNKSTLEMLREIGDERRYISRKRDYGPQRPVQGPPRRPVTINSPPFTPDPRSGRPQIEFYQDRKGEWRPMTPKQFRALKRAQDLAERSTRIGRRLMRHPIWRVLELVERFDEKYEFTPEGLKVRRNYRDKEPHPAPAGLSRGHVIPAGRGRG